jgi:hypothetical protein
VDYTVKNVKSRAVNVRIAEFIPAGAKLEKVKLPSFLSEPGAMVSRPTIAAGTTFKGSYEIVFSLK